MKRNIISIAAALLATATLAWADPTTPEGWYKEGENQYNLGNFDRAVDAFKKGFELETSESKKAAYLFNIAQAYRQAKNCVDAQFFYKRYLAFKDADTKRPLAPATRKEIEDRIAELEECAKQQEAIRNRPPDHNENPNPNPDNGNNGNTGNTNTPPDDKTVATNTNPDEDGNEIHDTTEHPTPEPGAPTMVSLRLIGGGAKISTGDVDVPLRATGGLVGGYPLPINEQLTLELGAAVSFTPVSFEDSMGDSQSASFTELLANVGATYEVAPKIGLRGDLGLGLLVMGGVSDSPFTDFNDTTGALSMFHVRVGVSADYAITPNLIATVAPIAFSYSPAKTGLADSISSITAIDFMVGVGYRR